MKINGAQTNFNRLRTNQTGCRCEYNLIRYQRTTTVDQMQTSTTVNLEQGVPGHLERRCNLSIDNTGLWAIL